jgi:hypothetical protein
MTLKKNGKYRYGDSQSDIHDELRRFGVLNAARPQQNRAALEALLKAPDDDTKA